MRYEATVEIDKKTLDRWNFLLSKDLLDMEEDEIEEYDAKEDDFESGFYVEFSDGSHITIDLCSGSQNYYDNVVWYSFDEEAPSYKSGISFDCMYEIDVDSPEEFYIGNNVYIINWKVKELEQAHDDDERNDR